MSAQELYERLTAQGVELWCEGRMLRFRVAEQSLSPEMVASLRKHKKALIELLERPTQNPSNETLREAPSLSQQALYFLHLAAPQSPAYNVASAFRIRSTLDTASVEQAFSTLISRHDALRTTFELVDGQLGRCIASTAEPDVRIVAASEWSEAELKQQVKDAYEEPFDLHGGPLLRVRLFHRGDQDWVFLLALHHIVFDAWSLWLVLDEFRQLYAQYAGGELALLPTPAARYTDFVHEQQNLQHSQRGEELWKYWRERLQGPLPMLELPTDRPRPLSTRLCGASHAFEIPKELTSQLRQLAKAQRVTPFVLMLTIYKVLLSRYSGQSDLIVGTATSGRTRSEFSRVVGYFVNSLPLRTDLSEEASFASYLQQVKRRCLEAMEHESYPFALLVERLNPPRVAGRLPIFSVMFDMQKPQRLQEAMQLMSDGSGPIDLGGLEVHPFGLDQQEGQFDLTLELFDTKESYAAIWKYNVDLFDASTIERMASHYVELARAIVADPDRPLDAYEFLPKSERDLLLEWGGKAVPLEGRFAHGLFEEQAALGPEQVALICEGESLSYKELDQQANQAAWALIELGVQPGDLVACCFSRGLVMGPVLLGIMKAGAVFVPLDTANPPTRLASLAHGCGAKLVLSDPSFAAESPVIADDLPVVSIAAFREQMQNCSTTKPPERIEPSATAYVIHTSGSTGTPKGVCVSHQALARHARMMQPLLGTTPNDRVLQFSRLTFDAAYEQLFVPWSLGASVVMRGSHLWSPNEMWEAVARESVTIVHFPPAYLRECVRDIHRDHPALRTLRLVISGGDVFPIEAAESFSKANIRVINEYGPTESVITATVFDATDFEPNGGTVPIGRPRPGTTAFVLDEHQRLVPIGMPGELALGGPMLADGYLNDPDLTRAKFISDPFSDLPDAKLYRTGDRVRWNQQGQLEFLGRTDHQVQIQGIRVEPGEVEFVITSCSGVRAAHVATRVDQHELTYLVAWVVPENAAVWSEPALRSELQAKLPRYMIPRQIISLEQLPMNSSGKINALALPSIPLGNGKPPSEYVPPETETERVLCRIWSEVLDVERVGTEDDYFELGGGSLLALRILTRAGEAGVLIDGQPIPPELLFEYPTIRQLAELAHVPS